jgi:hypothetical protein
MSGQNNKRKIAGQENTCAVMLGSTSVVYMKENYGMPNR